MSGTTRFGIPQITYFRLQELFRTSTLSLHYWGLFGDFLHDI